MSEILPVHNSIIVGLGYRDEALSATPTGGQNTYAVPLPQGDKSLVPPQTGGQSDQVMESITSGKADYWAHDPQVSAAAQAVIAKSTSQDQPDLAISSAPTQSKITVKASTTVDTTVFNWPSLQAPPAPTFTGSTLQAIDTQTVQYIFHSVLNRDQSSGEISTYSAEIDAHPTGPNTHDYTYAMNDVAHSQETTNKLQGAFNNDLGSSATSDIISRGETYLAQGVTFTTLVSTITSSSAEGNAIGAIYSQVLGRAIDSGSVSSVEAILANGSITLQQERTNVAYSQCPSTIMLSLWNQL